VLWLRCYEQLSVQNRRFRFNGLSIRPPGYNVRWVFGPPAIVSTFRTWPPAPPRLDCGPTVTLVLAHVLWRPDLCMREIIWSNSPKFKIRVTRNLDDERATRCLFSAYNNIKTDISKFCPFPVDVTLARPSTLWQLNTDDIRRILWFTGDAQRILWFNGVPSLDVSNDCCRAGTDPLTTPSQCTVVASGLMCVPPS